MVRLIIGQRLFGRVDPTPILGGLDARLIEAEAKLKDNDIAGMMTILSFLSVGARRQSPTSVARVPRQARRSQ